jgi:hypothetical protein
MVPGPDLRVAVPDGCRERGLGIVRHCELP